MSHITLYVLAQLRRWASFLIEYQICLENSSIPCRKNRQKVEHIRQRPAFSHYFGRPPPLPCIPTARFSAAPHIIPVSLVLSKNALIGETTYAYLILSLGKHVLLKEPISQHGKVLEVDLPLVLRLQIIDFSG